MNRVGLTDTPAEAQRVLSEVYRRMSPSRKLKLQVVGYSSERALHEAGVRSREPRATPVEIRRSWNLLRLGQAPWISEIEMPMDDSLDNLGVVREVSAAFTRLAIPYALGGSWASSFHGEPRSTFDAAISVEPFPGLESALVSSFGPDYYISLDAVTEAVRELRLFNIINAIAGFKVDVFVRKETPFARSVMSRRAQVSTEGDSGIDLVMISAEDTILLKLEWYRLGGEISERQWLDVLGVMRVQGDRLDQLYLDRWAGELGVLDLLNDARRDSEI